MMKRIFKMKQIYWERIKWGDAAYEMKSGKKKKKKNLVSRCFFREMQCLCCSRLEMAFYLQ